MSVLSFPASHLVTGTSACGTGQFYCANIGHTPSNIKTSRVNDGVCDEECCDGSDEYDGQTQCPNVCEEVGAKAREENDRIQSIQNEGARLRRGFIKHGKANKVSLTNELEALRGQVDHVQLALNDARGMFFCSSLAHTVSPDNANGGLCGAKWDRDRNV